MAFWDLDDGTSAVSDSKEYEAASGDFEPLPKGTNALVLVEDVAWKPGYQVSQEFANLKVRVMKPEAYAGRVLYFKLWVDELDPSVRDVAKAKTKRDKHKRMMMAIDANAKGKLARVAARPTDEQLAVALVGAQFVATLGVWDKEDDRGVKTPGGNWLMAARPKNTPTTEVETRTPARKAAPAFDDDLDDDVPF